MRPNPIRPLFIAAALAAGVAAAAAATPAEPPAAGTAPAVKMPPESRGRLLYETHCIACHTTKMHWRDNHKATDWSSLKGWVARWQSTLELNWTEQDVAEVARHLNDLYYHFPQAGNVVGFNDAPQPHR